MTLSEFRARWFNPEMWVRTGLAWSVLTLAVMTLFELLENGEVKPHNWLVRLGVFAIAGLLFGLLFRWSSRRGQSRAR